MKPKRIREQNITTPRQKINKHRADLQTESSSVSGKSAKKYKFRNWSWLVGKENKALSIPCVYYQGR
jgi:hypothetical protein